MPIDALAFLRRLSRHATARVRAGLRALSFAQSDRNGSHVGACLWSYRDRLPFTLGPQVETGREAGASHIRHDLRTAGAGQLAEGFKEKKAMKFAFQCPCRRSQRAAGRL
jgi:hypothetical protein